MGWGAQMAYTAISNFPDVSKLTFPELDALANVWAERRAELEGTGAYFDFLRKLQREWAIETGIIERLYVWDRGVTQQLIEQGIEASIIAHHGGVSQEKAAHIQAIIGDQLSIVDGLFAYVKGQEPLSEHFIRGLHAKFTANQDTTEAMTRDGQIIEVRLLKGEYKKQPNNPKRTDGTLHEYCPPELTGDEMQRLVQMYREAEEHVHPVVRSAWLHHRFTEIHPFQDGNGRVARALATLVFLRAGMFPLVIREADREEYISALEKADSGDLTPLCALFARRQRDAILKALGLEQQVQQSQYADQIIASAVTVLKDRFAREAAPLLSKVQDYAAHLENISQKRFEQLAKQLDARLRPLTPLGHRHYHAYSSRSSAEPDTRRYFYHQIVSTAKRVGYFANLETRREWVRLSILTDQTFDYVLSVHGLGSGDSGVLAVSAFSYIRAPKEEGGSEIANLHPASPDLFQFNYAEPLESIVKRFEEWIESSIAIALAEWKRTIQ